MSAQRVDLKEWDYASVDSHPALAFERLPVNTKLKDAIRAYKGKVDFQELRTGVSITTKSFVGRVQVGQLRIAINPKLDGLKLAQLMKYVYGLRNLKLHTRTIADTATGGLQDVIIHLLATEIEELLRHGLFRKYLSVNEELQNVRGRIDIKQVLRNGGIRSAALPCEFFERKVDWPLNRVLLAGVILAATLAEDRSLMRQLRRLAPLFGNVQTIAPLTLKHVRDALTTLTRQTQAASGALTLIELLVQHQGVSFHENESSSSIRGFLFDMNLFFQRLLSRFLRDYLPNASVIDEYAIRNLFSYSASANPQGRRRPTPRPDLGLLLQDKLQGFIDAKYRDLWQPPLPREWLYQMSIYALAAPNHTSVLLYATMAADAKDQCVLINHPSDSNRSIGSVIFRPVPIQLLADLVSPTTDTAILQQRHELASRLVSFHTNPEP